MKTAHLPPLPALRAFIEVAHCESFTQATQQLHLTQSAISRQIQQLEEHYGTALFVRNTRKVELTAAGKRLLPLANELMRKFYEIEQAMKGTSTFRLQSYLSVVTRWLLPRLRHFYRDYPHIQLSLEPAMSHDLQPEHTHADAVIMYGKPGKNWCADFLFDEHFTPVCSPQLKIKSLADLKKYTLLQGSTEGGDWEAWLQLHGITSLQPYKQQFFDAYDFAIDAAVRGLGVAIVDLNLVEEELKIGSLVRPFDKTLPDAGSYYLVYPKQNTHAELSSVRSWLLSTPSLHDDNNKR